MCLENRTQAGRMSAAAYITFEDVKVLVEYHIGRKIEALQAWKEQLVFASGEVSEKKGNRVLGGPRLRAG